MTDKIINIQNLMFNISEFAQDKIIKRINCFFTKDFPLSSEKIESQP